MKDGLKLEKISHFFQVLKLCIEKIAKQILWFGLLAKFHLKTLHKYFVYE